MNLIRRLRMFVIVLSYSVVAKETSATQIQVKDGKTTPLILVEEENSLQLAIPEEYHRHDKKIIHTYSYNSSEKKIKIACPVREISNLQKEWLEKENILTNSSVLVLFEESTLIKMENGERKLDCEKNATPSIKKTNKDCGQSEGKFYEVGYTVSNSSGTDIKFVYVYKICYSATQRKVIYSIHDIKSPNVMMWEVKPYHEPDEIFNTQLDIDVTLEKTLESLKGNYYLYEFVGEYDMPLYRWRITTHFLFNYTPISYNHILLEGMTKYDNYIRCFSKETGKTLTLYSGTHENNITVQRESTICFMKRTCNSEVLIKTFWRIIIDSEQRAIMIATQHAPMKCIIKKSLCPKNILVLDKYVGGGCTYLCPVNDEILESFSLPKMKITKDLTLDFPKMKNNEETVRQEMGNGYENDAQSGSQQNVHISDFGDFANFSLALAVVNSALSQNMMDAGIPGIADGSGNAYGHGDGLGHGDGTTGEGGAGIGGGDAG